MANDSPSSSHDGGETDAVGEVVAGVKFLTLQNIGSTILGFVFVAAVLRLLPADQYGIYVAVLLCVGVASAFATGGLDLASTRFMAFLSRRDTTKAWVTAKTIVILSLLFSTLTTVVFLALAPSISFYFTKSTSMTLPFILGSFWTLSISISGNFSGFIQGMKKYVFLSKMIFVSRATAVGFAIAALYATHSVIIPITAWILYYAIIIIWSLKVTGKELISSKGAHDYSSILRYSAPITAAALSNVVANSYEQFFVGGYLNTVSLGIYNASVTISTSLSVLYSGITTTFLPEASSRFGNQAEVANGLRLVVRYTSLLIIPASFLVASLASQLLELFSGKVAYLAGTTSLQLLAILFIFVPLQGILTALLLALGRTVNMLAVFLAMVATNVILSFFLVPTLGINGAALSNALVSVAGFVVAAKFTSQYLEALKEYGFYAKLLVASSAASIVVYALTKLVSSSILTLVPYSLVGIAISLACIKLLRALTAEDKRLLSRFLPSALQKFMNYL
jgi:O-antigen/teichoic acid export membrane protein